MSAHDVPRTDRPVLSCTGLSKHFGGVSALDDVSLTFHPGEVMALVGPNGAGKSTLIDTLTGYVKPDRGSVQIDGQALIGAPWRRARRAGIRRTFQHPKLATGLDVDENVLVGALGARRGTVRGVSLSALLPASLREMRRARAASGAALAFLGVRATGETGSLSMGEQRLTDLARAISVDHDIVFLDEPFAGGDTSGMERMGHAIRDLADQGCTVVVVDHHVDVLAELADRMVLMFQGAVVFDGPPGVGLASPEMRTIYFGDSDA